jgi:hypothetical protein
MDVPRPFALLLFDEELAGLPLRDRSSGSVAEMAIEVLGIAANATSVVVAVATIPDIARKLIAWIRGKDVVPSEVPVAQVRIHAKGGLEVIIPIPAGSASVDIAVAEISSAVIKASGNLG